MTKDNNTSGVPGLRITSHDAGPPRHRYEPVTITSETAVRAASKDAADAIFQLGWNVTFLASAAQVAAQIHAEKDEKKKKHFDDGLAFAVEVLNRLKYLRSRDHNEALGDNTVCHLTPIK